MFDAAVARRMSRKGLPVRRINKRKGFIVDFEFCQTTIQWKEQFNDE
jgi:hypothetical protein